MEKIKWLWVFFAVALLSCNDHTQWNDCFTNAGKETTIFKEVPLFSTLILDAYIDYIIIQDTSIAQSKIELKGPKNIINRLLFDMSNQTCTIKDGISCDLVRSSDVQISAIITVKDLIEIRSNSIKSLKSQHKLILHECLLFSDALADINLEVEAYSLSIKLYNSTKLTLTGKSEVIRGDVEQIASIDARNLEVEHVLLNSYSPLDSYFDATKTIYVSFYNDGNFYYKREPAEYKKVEVSKGKGKLLKLD